MTPVRENAGVIRERAGVIRASTVRVVTVTSRPATMRHRLSRSGPTAPPLPYALCATDVHLTGWEVAEGSVRALPTVKRRQPRVDHGRIGASGSRIAPIRP